MELHAVGFDLTLHCERVSKQIEFICLFILSLTHSYSVCFCQSFIFQSPLIISLFIAIGLFLHPLNSNIEITSELMGKLKSIVYTIGLPCLQFCFQGFNLPIVNYGLKICENPEIFQKF